MSNKRTTCPTLPSDLPFGAKTLLCNQLRQYGYCDKIGCPPSCPNITKQPLSQDVCDVLNEYVDIKGCYGCKSTPSPTPTTTEYPVYCKINQISLKNGKINYKCPWVIFWLVISLVISIIILIYFLTLFYTLFLSPYK